MQVITKVIHSTYVMGCTGAAAAMLQWDWAASRLGYSAQVLGKIFIILLVSFIKYRNESPVRWHVRPHEHLRTSTEASLLSLLQMTAGSAVEHPGTMKCSAVAL